MSKLNFRDGQINEKQFQQLLLELTRGGKRPDAESNSPKKVPSRQPSNESLPEPFQLKKESSGTNLRRIAGSTDSTQHSIDQEELQQFVHRINATIQNDRILSRFYPVRIDDFFDKCKDGLIIRYTPSLIYLLAN